MLAPVIKLEPLTPEELLILSEKLSEIHAVLFAYEPRLTRSDLELFIRTEFGRVGADTHITPREVIRDLIELLDIMMQHPESTAESLLSDGSFAFAADSSDTGEEDEFAEFSI